jgi:hypothetical protein
MLNLGIMKLSGLSHKPQKPDGYVKLGSMKDSLINFITPSIIMSFLFVCFVIGLGHEKIYHKFVAGEVQLNSLICAGIFYALWKILDNILLLYKTAKYLKRLEVIGESGNITPEQVNKLRRDLEKAGSLIDTKSMSDVLDNITVSGFLKFTDNDARLIKSKVGQRCNHNRTSVGYLSGLLIMMGLLGTYIGLLETIDEVGKAMAGLANVGGGGGAPSGEGGQMSDDQMSGFIGSIAAPLQGMGLAFSASLFGIGGSLIVSFFNFLGGHSQNHFIENLSRWIDERIPSPVSQGKKLAQHPQTPGSDDLKSWLASFVYMSQKTHDKIGNLVLVMSQTISTLTDQSRNTELIGKRQTEIHSALERITSHVEEFKGQNSVALVKSQEHLKNFEKSLTSIAAQTGFIKDGHQIMSTSLSTLSHRIESIEEGIRSSTFNLSEDINSIKHANEEKNADKQIFTSLLQDIKSSLSNLSKTEHELAQSITNLKSSTTTQNDVNVANLVWQLNSLLGELNKTNEDRLHDVFTKTQKNTSS